MQSQSPTFLPLANAKCKQRRNKNEEKESLETMERASGAKKR
jgi:hypothetical protein